ncbi:ECF RNA polymerase sigma factor SigW [Stieleria neptunia]|uniref:ECF RNA polymerase sigma factor SigW n=1 Tax=Stieleria neptunia TaxID=2527979 RepID=A0A518I1N2_9BACT|nr:sigma-70 family RNA polymerase sigma factor [Stieleria neptunia]QDV46966.1 ECF RNA polymerase sigma factor SigW [Stieleria neptunia]
MRGRSEPADATPSMDGSGGATLESNASLARRIMAQESGAFALLVERYHDFVFRICFAILRHRQDAEDATQDTFSRVAKYLDRWDPRRPLEPWLATVAGNRSRSHLARRKVFAPLTADDEPQTLATRQQHAADAMREEITLALGNLPDRQRAAFELFHEQSLSYVQIARQMQCPIGTVKTLVHRARLSLIEQLRQRDVVPGDSAGTAPQHKGALK